MSDLRQLMYVCPWGPRVEAMTPNGPVRQFTCPKCDLVVWPGQKHPYTIEEFDVSNWGVIDLEDFVEITDSSFAS